jgi:hypothetical protein
MTGAKAVTLDMLDYRMKLELAIYHLITSIYIIFNIGQFISPAVTELKDKAVRAKLTQSGAVYIRQ